MEKYTNMQYGKRKTWIVFSQIVSSIFLFVSSFFTEDISLASLFALILTFGVFFLAIQDISLDSLSVKEIKSTQKASMLQAIAQPFGTVIGSLFLLKLTSAQFSQKIGLVGALTTPNNIIRIVSLSLIITSIVIHYSFKQTFLECEQRGNKKAFCQIITYAKIFMNIRSKYCRTVIFILIYNQGLKFYDSGYEYQLIRAGFSRDNLNSISNLIVFPVIAITIYISNHANKIGLQNIIILCLIVQSLIYSFNIIFLPLDSKCILFTQFITQLCINMKNMMVYNLINRFPIHALTGMFNTIILSFWNISQIKTINTLFIDAFGWRICAFVGIGLQIFIIFALYISIFQWIDQGIIQIDPQIANDNKYQSNSILTYSSNNQNLQSQEDKYNMISSNQNKKEELQQQQTTFSQNIVS